MIFLYDSNNVMLRDLEKIGHERLGLRRRFEISNDGNCHIWVWDGRGHNERRRAIFPAYKLNRAPKAEDRYAQIGVFREVLTHSKAIQIEVPLYEGDDVIHTLAVRFSRKNLPATVVSNDADYFQLLAHRGITLDGVKPLDCDPQHTPLYKATVGDPADNIIGIPSFGVKTWAALSHDQRNTLQQVIEEQDFALASTLPLPKRILTKLADPEIMAQANAALQITRFYIVPDAELDAGIKKGVLNRQAADALLRRFFL